MCLVTDQCISLRMQRSPGASHNRTLIDRVFVNMQIRLLSEPPPTFGLGWDEGMR